MWAVMCVCRHVCYTQERSGLSTRWALNCCFAWVFGTAQGGGGKKIRAWKKFSRGVGVPGLAREKKTVAVFS